MISHSSTQGKLSVAMTGPGKQQTKLSVEEFIAEAIAWGTRKQSFIDMVRECVADMKDIRLSMGQDRVKEDYHKWLTWV